MVKNPIKASNWNITNSQLQDLDNVIKMSKILKGKLDQTQKSHASWLATTIKKIFGNQSRRSGYHYYSSRHKNLHSRTATYYLLSMKS